MATVEAGAGVWLATGAAEVVEGCSTAAAWLVAAAEGRARAGVEVAIAVAVE